MQHSFSISASEYTEQICYEQIKLKVQALTSLDNKSLLYNTAGPTVLRYASPTGSQLHLNTTKKSSNFNPYFRLHPPSFFFKLDLKILLSASQSILPFNNQGSTSQFQLDWFIKFKNKQTKKQTHKSVVLLRKRQKELLILINIFKRPPQANTPSSTLSLADCRNRTGA